MKTLKLQVGKTYRNRKGEEVKIVRKIDSIWAFVGNNEESYNEQGRYYSANWSSPYDLIEEVEEVPEPTRHTFDIPDGVKKVAVEQVGNRIVVEMVPEERKEPKPGDVMINAFGSVYILKLVTDGGTHKHYAWLGISGRLSINTNTMCNPGRPATPEEAQPLFDALKKAGKRWNPQTMQVEDIKPKPGDVMVNDRGSVYIFKSVVDDDNHEHYAWLGEDDLWVEIGMCCTPGRPATPEEAQPLWDALKKDGKRWNPETMQVEDVPEIDHICEWVEKHLNCRYYSHESLTKVICDYLKYREGEK